MQSDSDQISSHVIWNFYSAVNVLGSRVKETRSQAAISVTFRQTFSRDFSKSDWLSYCTSGEGSINTIMFWCDIADSEIDLMSCFSDQRVCQWTLPQRRILPRWHEWVFLPLYIRSQWDQLRARSANKSFIITLSVILTIISTKKLVDWTVVYQYNIYIFLTEVVCKPSLVTKKIVLEQDRYLQLTVFRVQ